VVAYCGGSFNFRDGWVVTTYRAGPFGPWNGGHPIEVRYMSAGVETAAFLNEPDLPEDLEQNGFATPEEAEANAAGAYITIEHSGGPIYMHFTDAAYTDNRAPPAPDCTPIFAIYGENMGNPTQANLTALSTRSTQVGGGGTGVYDVWFKFHNNDAVAYGPILAKCLPTGGVLSSEVAGPSAISASTTLEWKIRITVDQSLSSEVTATVLFYYNDNCNIGQLEYDLFPIVTVDSYGFQGSACPNQPHPLNLYVTITGLVPYETIAAVELSGGISSTAQRGDPCIVSTQFPPYPLNYGGSGIQYMIAFAASGNSATLSIQWKGDGGADLNATVTEIVW
jgi:hypothetical protein